MRITKLAIGVFTAILFVSGSIYRQAANPSSNGNFHVVPQSSPASTLIADGGDPVPRPWIV